MLQVTPCVAVWWGYAEGNATIVGAVVGVVVLAAMAYVIRRIANRSTKAGPR
jgi:hypothetical protein